MHLPQPHSPSTIDAALLELVVTVLSVGRLIHSTSERLYRAPLSALCSFRCGCDAGGLSLTHGCFTGGCRGAGNAN